MGSGMKLFIGSALVIILLAGLDLAANYLQNAHPKEGAYFVYAGLGVVFLLLGLVVISVRRDLKKKEGQDKKAKS